MLSLNIYGKLQRMNKLLIFIFLSSAIIPNMAGQSGLTIPAEAQSDGDDVIVSIIRDATNFDDQSYQPNPVNISIGDTILWTNDDSARHTVTGLNSESINSILVEQDNKQKGIIENIVNEIETNIVYNLNNIIGLRDYTLSSETNGDLQSHSVSPGSPSNDITVFDSGIMETGDTFRYTFQEPGTFEYYCTIHPNMVGKVLVS